VTRGCAVAGRPRPRFFWTRLCRSVRGRGV